MATIKVLSAGAVEAMVRAIGAEYAKATGDQLDLNFNTAGALRDRVRTGEATDLVILPPPVVSALEKDGFVVAGSAIDLARTVTGVVVKAGATAPDISTPEAFKQALLDAPTVSYTDPKAGGSSGTFFRGLLERLGLAEAVAKKEVLGNRGTDVARIVAEGRAAIGTTFISEILTVPGTKVVGPLPGELHNVNTYTAAIASTSQAREPAATLIQALTDPAHRQRWITAGLEPAF